MSKSQRLDSNRLASTGPRVGKDLQKTWKGEILKIELLESLEKEIIGRLRTIIHSGKKIIVAKEIGVAVENLRKNLYERIILQQEVEIPLDVFRTQLCKILENNADPTQVKDLLERFDTWVREVKDRVPNLNDFPNENESESTSNNDSVFPREFFYELIKDIIIKWATEHSSSCDHIITLCRNLLYPVGEKIAGIITPTHVSSLGDLLDSESIETAYKETFKPYFDAIEIITQTIGNRRFFNPGILLASMLAPSLYVKLTEELKLQRVSTIPKENIKAAIAVMCLRKLPCTDMDVQESIFGYLPNKILRHFDALPEHLNFDHVKEVIVMANQALKAKMSEPALKKIRTRLEQELDEPDYQIDPRIFEEMFDENSLNEPNININQQMKNASENVNIPRNQNTEDIEESTVTVTRENTANEALPNSNLEEALKLIIAEELTLENAAVVISQCGARFIELLAKDIMLEVSIAERAENLDNELSKIIGDAILLVEYWGEEVKKLFSSSSYIPTFEQITNLLKSSEELVSIQWKEKIENLINAIDEFGFIGIYDQDVRSEEAGNRLEAEKNVCLTLNERDELPTVDAESASSFPVANSENPIESTMSRLKRLVDTMQQQQQQNHDLEVLNQILLQITKIYE